MPNSHRATRKTAGSSERGAFLLAVVVLAVILGGLSLAFLQEGLAERSALHHHETSLLALEIAEAGLIRAELEIQALTDPEGDGIGTVSGIYGGGSYEVTATQDAAQPDRWMLVAEGRHGLSARLIEVGLRRRERSYFVEGLFSRDDLLLNGSLATDSYDSRKGDWASQAVNWDAGGSYAGGRGHVGSNAEITVHGSKAHIRGNAIPGPLQEVETTGHPVITGDQLPRERAIPIPDPPEAEFIAALQNNDNGLLMAGGSTDDSPPVDDGSDSGDDKVTGKDKDKTNNGNAGDDGATTVGVGNTGYDEKTMSLAPKGQTEVVLTGGTYFFTDIDLSGGTTIRVTGTCRIYVTGNLDLTGGGVVNETGVASNCLIFAHPYALPAGHDPSSGEIKLAGNSQAALAIYAPERNATLLGTSDLFGAVLGKQINVKGDAQFHYDEALSDMLSNSVVYMERLYWREVNELPR